MATPAVPDGDAVRKADVVDLTSKMRPDGRLDWTPPAGRWIVLRFGYSLTGARNSPASPEATGLEVDKLDRAHVKAYFDNYLDQYKNATGGLMGKRGLQYVITDSWEAGTANWTDKMFAEFAQRRGYDMHPWLPVLAGRIVESAEASDRFLWDFRKTLGDLVAEIPLRPAHRHPARPRHGPLHGIARGRPRLHRRRHGGQARRPTIPMSATWLERPGKASPHYDADVRESASVAHIYGQNLVAAESLTVYRNAWAYLARDPEVHRRPDDVQRPEPVRHPHLGPPARRRQDPGARARALRPVVHPARDLGGDGQALDDLPRPQLVHAPAGPLRRRHRSISTARIPTSRPCSASKMPDIPAGYSFDFVNADALLNRLSVKTDGSSRPPA